MYHGIREVFTNFGYLVLTDDNLNLVDDTGDYHYHHDGGCYQENAMMQEMNLQEMEEVNGGFDFGSVLVLISAGIYIYNEGGDFIEGFKETFNK